MTGREQHEWFERWVKLGRPYLRMPAATLGLRGTDPERITSAEQLVTALEVSPTLARRDRPTNVSDEEWNTATEPVRRVLFQGQARCDKSESGR